MLLTLFYPKKNCEHLIIPPFPKQLKLRREIPCPGLISSQDRTNHVIPFNVFGPNAFGPVLEDIHGWPVGFSK